MFSTIQPSRAPLLKRYEEQLKVLLEYESARAMVKEAQMELDSAYRYGRAEMASAVLHDLRNLLNPLVARLSQIQTELGRSSYGNVRHALDELDKGRLEPARHRKLLEFLAACFTNLSDERSQLLSQVNVASSQVAQIERILLEFRLTSHTDISRDAVRVWDILEELRPNLLDIIDSGIQVKLDSRLQDMPQVVAKRFPLKQVFLNLISNARDAIQEPGRRDSILEIAAKIETLEGCCFVRLGFKDTGCGIKPSDLSRIFQRGFSTKSPAINGSGLHWCANWINEIGGKIYAESRGEGLGATFHVLLRQYKSARQRSCPRESGA